MVHNRTDTVVLETFFFILFIISVHHHNFNVNNNRRITKLKALLNFGSYTMYIIKTYNRRVKNRYNKIYAVNTIGFIFFIFLYSPVS